MDGTREDGRYGVIPSQGIPRATVLKLKINGLCVRDCSFCPFHHDPSLLEVAHLEKLFSLWPEPTYEQLVINGGEPTIHPRFDEICTFLRGLETGGASLEIGTNLVTVADGSPRARKLLDTMLQTFGRFRVGCDDEHRNIDILERLAPEILKAGRGIIVNAVVDHCGEDVRKRLRRLWEDHGVKVLRSQLMHDVRQTPRLREQGAPCLLRLRELVFDCNGDAFFCCDQEFEKPAFNLKDADAAALRYYLKDFDPAPYAFCDHCSRYVRDVHAGAVCAAASSD